MENLYIYDVNIYGVKEVCIHAYLLIILYQSQIDIKLDIL